MQAGRHAERLLPALVKPACLRLTQAVVAQRGPHLAGCTAAPRPCGGRSRAVLPVPPIATNAEAGGVLSLVTGTATALLQRRVWVAARLLPESERELHVERPIVRLH